MLLNFIEGDTGSAGKAGKASGSKESSFYDDYTLTAGRFPVSLCSFIRSIILSFVLKVDYYCFSASFMKSFVFFLFFSSKEDKDFKTGMDVVSIN